MSNNIKVDFGTSGGMSLCIPYISSDITCEYIRHVIEDQEKMGVLRLIKLVNRETSAGKKYRMAYIYFKYWYDTVNTRNFQIKVQEKQSLPITYYKNRYWNVSPSKYWLAETYLYKEEYLQLQLEMSCLREEFDIQKDLITKYRDSNYNDTFESIFNRDMREMMGVGSEQNYFSD